MRTKKYFISGENLTTSPYTHLAGEDRGNITLRKFTQSSFLSHTVIERFKKRAGLNPP
jgi:hypothetical protein